MSYIPITKLPSIPVNSLCINIFSDVIKIYKNAAGLTHRCTDSTSTLWTRNVVSRLVDDKMDCEFTLGSKFSRDTKFVLRRVNKPEGPHVAFDFIPGSSTKAELKARILFHTKLFEYFDLARKRPV